MAIVPDQAYSSGYVPEEDGGEFYTVRGLLLTSFVGGRSGGVFMWHILSNYIGESIASIGGVSPTPSAIQ